MKIICSKSSLLKSVSIALKAVPSKTTMPILECILMDATTNQIKFTTNDMELGIETIVEGTIEEKGKVALDAKIFYEIIRRLPDNDVTIKTDDKYAATITCEKAKFNIPGKSGEDFAYLPMIERDEPLTISQYTLKNMIYQTIFSIAVNDNNKLMTGELFEIKDNCLKIVSLDGHRIAIRKMPLKKDYSDRKVVVPGKTLNEISKILSGEMEPDSGSYKWGVTTTQSYFPKDNTKDFSQDETIVEWLTQYSEDKDATFVRGFLGRMLFSGEDALKKVGVLSGGEKVRCMLSKLMISGANILLLDEPTNHLDMESITALNEALKDFSGALLFTSQDHQFVQTTANRIMEITPNGLIDKECTYDEYLENDEAARKRQIVEIEEDDE